MTKTWMLIAPAALALGACTLILGDDFEIAAGGASGGSSVSSAAGANGPGGNGGAGGSGGGVQLPAIDCSWDVGKEQTLLSLLGQMEPTFDDDIFGVLNGDNFMLVTSRYLGGGAYGAEVYSFHGDGNYDTVTFPANDALGVDRVGGSRTGILYKADPSTNAVAIQILNNAPLSLANVDQVVPASTLPGSVDRAIFKYVPDQSQLSDFIVVLDNQVMSDYSTYFYRVENSVVTHNTRIARPDVLLGYDDYRPQALARIGGTNHLYLGFSSMQPSRYFAFPDTVATDPAPTYELPADQFGFGLAPHGDGALLNGAFAELSGQGMGTFHVGVLAPADLAMLDVSTLPASWTLTDMADAPGRGQWGWYGKHYFMPGRREGSQEDMKLLIIHESGQLRANLTLPLMPTPPSSFLRINAVTAVPNGAFDSLTGDVYVGWVEVHLGGTPPAEYQVLRFGVLNCQTQ